MTIKPRSPGKTAISVSMTQALLDQVDQRASALNLTRSQYISQLARADVAAGGDLTLKENSKTKHVSSIDQAGDEIAAALKPSSPKKPAASKLK